MLAEIRSTDRQIDKLVGWVSVCLAVYFLLNSTYFAFGKERMLQPELFSRAFFAFLLAGLVLGSAAVLVLIHVNIGYAAVFAISFGALVSTSPDESLLVFSLGAIGGCYSLFRLWPSAYSAIRTSALLTKRLFALVRLDIDNRPTQPGEVNSGGPRQSGIEMLLQVVEKETPTSGAERDREEAAVAWLCSACLPLIAPIAGFGWLYACLLMRRQRAVLAACVSHSAMLNVVLLVLVIVIALFLRDEGEAAGPKAVCIPALLGFVASVQGAVMAKNGEVYSPPIAGDIAKRWFKLN